MYMKTTLVQTLSNIRRHYVFTCIIILITFFCCGANTPQGEHKNTGVTLDRNFTINKQFNESALLLAGMPIPAASSLYMYSQTNEYASYCTHIEKNWSRLQYANQQKIVQWRDKFLPYNYTKTVFYPFSGPDIINALIFFPDGAEYIMFGLELPGEIPAPHALPVAKIRSGLSGLGVALNNVLNVNYFKTINMAKEISTDSFNSITGVIMFFLSRTGHEVVDVKKVWIDNNSVLVTALPQKKEPKMIPGVEILFRKSTNAPLKRVRYFQLNVIDYSLATYTNFIPYLESQGRFTTIIKSASYLMHNDTKFTKIRALTLSHSDYILQDDSGIALRFFPPQKWKLTFHGTYSKPVSLFAHRYQQDFMDAMKKYSTGPLPFSYGYNFRENESNLMFAKRVGK